jgi:S1-C subfamily serine protease
MRAAVLIAVGQPVLLTIWRAGKEQEVAMTVAEWPNRKSGAGGDTMTTSVAKAMIQKPPDLGLSLAPLTDAARSHYRLDPKLTAILVTAVEKDCEGSTLGVVPGDVITMGQDVPVASPVDVSRARLAVYEQHHAFIAMLLRGKGGTRWVSLSMDGTKP